MMALKGSLAAPLIALCALALPLSSNAQLLERYSDQEFIRQIAEVEGDIWIAANSGAYRIQGESRTPILKGSRVYSIAEVENQTWLGSEGGLFRVEGDTPEPLLRAEIGTQQITVIKKIGGVILVGTNRGLWEVEAQVVSKPRLNQPVHTIAEIYGKTWIATRGNIYRRDSDGSLTTIFTDFVDVIAIVGVDSSIWVTTSRQYGLPGAIYRLDDDQPIRVYPESDDLLPELEILAVGEIEGKVVIGTTRGLYALNDGRPEPIQEAIEEPVNTIAELDNNQVWLGTTKGVYLNIDDKFTLIPSGEPINVKEISYFSGETWVRTTSGAFRFEEASPSGLNFENRALSAEALALATSVILLLCLLIARRRKRPGIARLDTENRNVDKIHQ